MQNHGYETDINGDQYLKNILAAVTYMYDLFYTSILHFKNASAWLFQFIMGSESNIVTEMI